MSQPNETVMLRSDEDKKKAMQTGGKRPKACDQPIDNLGEQIGERLTENITRIRVYIGFRVCRKQRKQDHRRYQSHYYTNLPGSTKLDQRHQNSTPNHATILPDAPTPSLTGVPGPRAS